MILAIALGLIGLLLVFFEFYVPGGIIGIFGGLCIVGSVVLFFLQKPPMYLMILYLVLLFLFLIFVIRFALYKIRFSKRKDTIFLHQDQEGYVASKFRSELIGKKGKTFSVLKPSGHVMIEGEKFQALSESGYLEKDTSIEVIRGSGAHLVVKLIKEG